MKETLYTIPLMDAFNEEEECAFCVIERKLEQDALDYILGSGAAYMQVDIREVTDKIGFCQKHFKDMFHYGNALGNAIMLSSYYHRVNTQLAKRMESSPLAKKTKLFKKKSDDEEEEAKLSISAWIKDREEECQICGHFKDTYVRYLDTFFYMLKEDENFYKRVMQSKGFFLHHYAQIADGIEKHLSGDFKAKTMKDINQLMKENMNRVEGDLNWFIEKFDYRNRDADWKNSRDALQRAMQKIGGGFPADTWYVSKK